MGDLAYPIVSAFLPRPNAERSLRRRFSRFSNACCVAAVAAPSASLRRLARRLCCCGPDSGLQWKLSAFSPHAPEPVFPSYSAQSRTDCRLSCRQTNHALVANLGQHAIDLAGLQLGHSSGNDQSPDSGFSSLIGPLRDSQAPPGSLVGRPASAAHCSFIHQSSWWACAGPGSSQPADSRMRFAMRGRRKDSVLPDPVPAVTTAF